MCKFSTEGLAIHQALINKGIETPFKPNFKPSPSQQSQIQQKVQEILELLGLDMRNDSLSETPLRIAKMFSQEIFYGLNYANFPEITKLANTLNGQELVQVNNINLNSICEHHFLPIDGVVSVAYLPKEWILGLSKFNRIVDFFAKRPQVQERLTQQILVAFQTLLETEDVAVRVKAQHFCVKARGLEDQNTVTVTQALRGKFLEDSYQQAFLYQCDN